jgi:hypothetical protein
MKHIFIRRVVVLLIAGFPQALYAQLYDFGDAPDGAIAYPSISTPGNFPTCSSNGIFIQHGWFQTPTLFFGASADVEPDGNAGFCPSFTPYDQDECMNDGDAGLLMPTAYTIDAFLDIQPCPSTMPPYDSLGMSCDLAVWGVDVDIILTEQWGDVAYVNVLMDWNHDGVWSGAIDCPDGQSAPEHVLANFQVIGPYSGALSGFSPPEFRIGPNSGYVWTRFTITYEPVSLPWDGSGIFEEGETEDYLLWVPSIEDQADYGDAPEDALAYPSLGVIGQFPTCKTVGPANWYVEHLFPGQFFGWIHDTETDGNAGQCPAFNNQYNQDECFTDGDAGLLFPESFTILGPPGSESVIPCPGAAGMPLGLVCTWANWGMNIDIHIDNSMGPPGYVNVLADWNQDGQWSGSSVCPEGPTPEHILVDHFVPAGFVGPLSALGPLPPFMIGPNDGYVWFRFTISDVPVGSGWLGNLIFMHGETEDYLLWIYPDEEPPPEADYGDAPEDAIAYPTLGVIGQFPTCQFVGTPDSYITHLYGNMFFGSMRDSEMDGNAGLCPVFTNQYDQDECSMLSDPDSGLLITDAYTIVGLPGSETVIPCPGTDGIPLGISCNQAIWGVNIDLHIDNFNGADAFVNILADWNQDGQWGGGIDCPDIGYAPEHVLIDWPVFAGYVGPLVGLGPPAPFLIGPNDGYVWFRFTITDVPLGPEWTGEGVFLQGETEDYLLRIDAAPDPTPTPTETPTPPPIPATGSGGIILLLIALGILMGCLPVLRR